MARSHAAELPSRQEEALRQAQGYAGARLLGGRVSGETSSQPRTDGHFNERHPSISGGQFLLAVLATPRIVSSAIC
jgi:hypothetical protein